MEVKIAPLLTAAPVSNISMISVYYIDDNIIFMKDSGQTLVLSFTPRICRNVVKETGIITAGPGAE